MKSIGYLFLSALCLSSSAFSANSAWKCEKGLTSDSPDVGQRAELQLADDGTYALYMGGQALRPLTLIISGLNCNFSKSDDSVVYCEHREGSKWTSFRSARSKVISLNSIAQSKESVTDEVEVLVSSNESNSLEPFENNGVVRFYVNFSMRGTFCGKLSSDSHQNASHREEGENKADLVSSVCAYDSQDYNSDINRCSFVCSKPNDLGKVKASCKATVTRNQEALTLSKSCPAISECVKSALESKPSLDLNWVFAQ